MFVVDVSPSMGRERDVEIEQSNGETRTIQMTNLEWALQFVKLKVQEMVGLALCVDYFVNSAAFG